LTVFVD